MVLNIKIILCNNKFLSRNLINPEIQACSALVANDSFDITTSFNPSLRHDNIRVSKHLVNLSRVTRFTILTAQESQPYRTPNNVNNVSSLYKSINNTPVSSLPNEDYEHDASPRTDNTTFGEIKVSNGVGHFSIFNNYSAFKRSSVMFKDKNKISYSKKILYSFLKRQQHERYVLSTKQKSNISRHYPQGLSGLAYEKYTMFKLDESHGYKNQGTTSDLILNRIRFKPGYQRMWRESRSVLADSLNKRYTYQQQLTRFISNLSKSKSKFSQATSSVNLSTFLIHSHLVQDYKLCIELFNANCIYVNGLVISNPKFTPVVGDNVQLSISTWFYSYSKLSIIWSDLSVKSLKRLIYRKTGKSQLGNSHKKKQRSRSLPKWVSRFEGNLLDVPLNMEVDFFTFSAFCLDNSNLNSTQSHYILTKDYILKNYNWKYIV